MFDKVQNIRGPGVTNRPDGIAIRSVPQRASRNISQQERKVYAVITAVAAMGASDSRWVYTISQVDISVTYAGGAITDVGVSATNDGISGIAINLSEIRNEGSSGIAFSVDRAGSDYPAGFDPVPISGGGNTQTHQQNVIVEVVGKLNVEDENQNNVAVYLIDRMGAHDGDCS